MTIISIGALIGVLPPRAAIATNELTGHRNAKILDTLAAAYAAAGQFDQAVATAKKAIELAAGKDHKLGGQIKKRHKLYQKEKPFRGTTD